MEFDILELGRLEKARTLIAQNGLPLVKKAQKLRVAIHCVKVLKQILCGRRKRNMFKQVYGCH